MIFSGTRPPHVYCCAKNLVIVPFRPVYRQEGFEGVRSNPPFDLQKILQLYILSVLPFESGLLDSLLSRTTAVQTSLVTAIEFVRGGPARNARGSCLRYCDGRMRVNIRA